MATSPRPRAKSTGPRKMAATKTPPRDEGTRSYELPDSPTLDHIAEVLAGLVAKVFHLEEHLCEKCLADVEERLVTITNSVAAVDERVTNLQTDLDAQVTALRADLGTAETNITNLGTQVTTLGTGLGTAETNITNLNERVAVLQAGLATTQADVTTLDGRVTALQSDLATTKGDLAEVDGRTTTLETDLATTNGDVTNLGTRATTLETDLGDVEKRVETLEKPQKVELGRLAADLKELKASAGQGDEVIDKEVDGLVGDLNVLRDTVDMDELRTRWRAALTRMELLVAYVQAGDDAKDARTIADLFDQARRLASHVLTEVTQ